MNLRQTHTFARLEIDPRAFEDIKERLKAAGVLWDYLDHTNDGGSSEREVLRLQGIELIGVEQACPCKLCEFGDAVAESGRAMDSALAAGYSRMQCIRELIRRALNS